MIIWHLSERGRIDDGGVVQIKDGSASARSKTSYAAARAEGTELWVAAFSSAAERFAPRHARWP